MADIIRSTTSVVYFMSWFRSRRFEVDQQCRVLYIRYDLVYYADTSRESTYLIIHPGVNPCLIILQTLLSLIISACNLSLSLSFSIVDIAFYPAPLMKQLVIWRHFTPTWICRIAMDSIARVNIFIGQFIEPIIIIIIFPFHITLLEFRNLLFNLFYRIKNIHLFVIEDSFEIFLQGEIFKFHWNHRWSEIALFFWF